MCKCLCFLCENFWAIYNLISLRNKQRQVRFDGGNPREINISYDCWVSYLTRVKIWKENANRGGRRITGDRGGYYWPEKQWVKNYWPLLILEQNYLKQFVVHPQFGDKICVQMQFKIALVRNHAHHPHHAPCTSKTIHLKIAELQVCTLCAAVLRELRALEHPTIKANQEIFSFSRGELNFVRGVLWIFLS